MTTRPVFSGHPVFSSLQIHTTQAVIVFSMIMSSSCCRQLVTSVPSFYRHMITSPIDCCILDKALSIHWHTWQFHTVCQLGHLCHFITWCLYENIFCTYLHNGIPECHNEIQWHITSASKYGWEQLLAKWRPLPQRKPVPLHHVHTK
jgi:hypothetical protein